MVVSSSTCLLSTFSLVIQVTVSLAFSTSSLVLTRPTTAARNHAVYSPSADNDKKVTSIFLSAGAFDEFSLKNEEDDDDDDDDDEFVNFQAYVPIDVDSARRQLESLVVGPGGLEEHEVSPSLSSNQQQQPRRTTLTNIRLHKDEHAQPSSSIAATALPSGASIASSPSMSDVVEPPPLSIDLPQRPPMTTIERERRLAEIDALKNLLVDDDGSSIADLWSLWFSERGPQAESILRDADELMGGHVRDQLEAERLLRSLIEEYGVYFVEPINRLATLYFTQGRMEESLALNKIVLAVKPWHVGALSHIVMVYEAMGDSMMARSWARFRLPNSSSGVVGRNKRREKWVERAIHDATRMLEMGDMNNAMNFGEPDRNWINRQPASQTKGEEDAWQ